MSSSILSFKGFHLNIQFTFIQPRQQCFSLPTWVIRYIRSNPFSHNGYLKLLQTCKYFFDNKNKIIIVDELLCLNERLRNRKKGFKILPFSGKVKYWGRMLFIHSNKNLTNPFQNLYCVDLKCLFIESQKLTETELNFLLANQKITWAEFWNIKIRDSQKIPISMDQILEKLPHAYRIVYRSHIEIFTPKTFQKMCAVKRKSEISFFDLYIPEISEEINSWLFCHFIIKHAAKNSRFKFAFSPNVSYSFVKEIKKAVKELNKNWILWEKEHSPWIEIW